MMCNCGGAAMMSENPRPFNELRASVLSEEILAKLRTVLNECDAQGPELAWAGIVAAAELLGGVCEHVSAVTPGSPSAAEFTDAALKAVRKLRDQRQGPS
jgi:hypothetical protein